MEIYKPFTKDENIITKVICECTSISNNDETIINSNNSNNSTDINNILDQIKIEFTKLTENSDDSICESAYSFITNVLNDQSIQDFLQFCIDNDVFIQIFLFMINFLKESDYKNGYCCYAIHIINQLIHVFPMNQTVFDDLFQIGINYISMVIDDYSDNYFPILNECFNLFVKENQAINHLIPKSSTELFDKYCEKYLIENIKCIKFVMNNKNDNIEILQIAINSSLYICEENNISIKYFINLGFIDLCFQIMNEMNAAFYSTCMLLEKLELELNEEEMIATFPNDYHFFFQRFLIDQPDEIIKSAIHLISHFTYSSIFISKMLQLENFLEYLIFSDQSFKVKKAFLFLFHNIIYYHFQYVEQFISNFNDFNFFSDSIYNGSTKEVNCILKIVCSIVTNARFTNPLPDYFIKILESEQLMDEIRNITLNQNEIYSYENQILALRIINIIDDLCQNSVGSASN